MVSCKLFKHILLLCSIVILLDLYFKIIIVFTANTLCTRVDTIFKTVTDMCSVIDDMSSTTNCQPIPFDQDVQERCECKCDTKDAELETIKSNARQENREKPCDAVVVCYNKNKMKKHARNKTPKDEKPTCPCATQSDEMEPITDLEQEFDEEFSD